MTVNHPRMTSRGRALAAGIALLVLALVPKQVPCRFPGDACERLDVRGRLCTTADTEPAGVWALEWILRRDVPITYKRQETCR